jgi:uncharacterized protein with von Willebrand factor type A (vWA) domain
MMLKNRDYTLIIDKSGSMAATDLPDGKSRWAAAQDAALALASQCEQFDPDGIAVYLFSDGFQRNDNVQSGKVAPIFAGNLPDGGTNLAGVLKDATESYFQRKAAGQAKQNGEAIFVITDGESDREAVTKVVLEASNRMDRAKELEIFFIQIGSDSQATQFLKRLGEELQKAGTKFNICETVTAEEVGNMSVTEVVMNAANQRTPAGFQARASIEARDYTLIIDKSGSMSTKDQPGGKSRWAVMQESTLAVARKCEQIDPDGIAVYTFSGRFKRYDSVTASKVEQIFQENEPVGGTNLAAVLQDAVNNYFRRKAVGQTKPEGETIIVVTDGEPEDRKAVMEVIINASRKIERDEELAISFIQVGTDATATQFLKALDDQLQGAGAKFDIVDTVTFEDMEDMTLTEVLLKAIVD